jgi:capsular exopolysaccharide synthesis family protein
MNMPQPPSNPVPTNPLGQGGTGGSARFKPIDPLRVVRQYIVVLVIAGILGVGLGVGSYVLRRAFWPTWSSQMYIEANPGSMQLENLDVNSVGQIHQDKLAIYINTQAQRIMQEDLLRTALQRDSVANTRFVQRIKREAEDSGQHWLDLGVERLDESILNASMMRETALLRVSAGTRNPGDAQQLVETVVSVYMDQVERNNRQKGANLREVFLAERDRARNEIDRLQQQQTNFRQQNSLVSLNQAHDEAGIDYQHAAEHRAELESRLAQAQSTYRALKQRQEQGTLDPDPSELTQVERLEPIQLRIERLAQARETLDVQRRQYGENHRFTEQTRRRIDAIEAEKKRLTRELLRKQRAAQLSQARQQVESLKSQLEQTRENLKSASVRLTELGTRLNRYQAMEQQLTAARERRAQANDAIEQLRMKQGPVGLPMEVQGRPSEPQITSPKLVVTVGGVTMLVLGVVTGLVFLRELMDQRMRAPADVSLVSDTEVLGVLPDTSEDPSGRRRLEGVVERHPTGLLAECFRQVRTAVLSKMDRRGYRTLMLAGAQPGCGTSSVTQNLAMSLGHNGRRVLIMDCNFRRPQQHKLAGLDNQAGLVDVLQGEATLSGVVQAIEGSNVSVLPTGQAQHAQPELLESQTFRTTLSQLESEYDCVLLDAPPALLTSECRMLSKLVDALAVVVRAGREKRGMVSRMLRQLEGQRADLLGVVLNGVQSSAGGYFRKSYRAFYDYSTNGANDSSEGRARASGKGRERTPAN